MSDRFRELLDSDYREMIEGDFSESVTISDGAGQEASIRGLFEKSYLEVNPDTGAAVMSTKPRVSVWPSGIAFTIRQGHTVMAGGKSYRVRELQPDGQGCVVLYLE